MNYKEIDPQEAHEVIKSHKDVLLLDVREQHEYDRAHIEGVTLIPLGTLPEKLQELDKSKSTLCICAGGVRSEKAARFLLEQGFEDVTNMTEGMSGWLSRSLPSQQ